MQRLCDWVKGRSISVSYIYIYIYIDMIRYQESFMPLRTIEEWTYLLTYERTPF